MRTVRPERRRVGGGDGAGDVSPARGGPGAAPSAAQAPGVARGAACALGTASLAGAPGGIVSLASEAGAITAARALGAAGPAASFALLLVACALAPLFAGPGTPAETDPAAPFEWPTQLDGRPLRPLAPSAVERRLARAFPGAIGRFSDGERLLVLRRVERPTRMLHPAADCWRGLGYAIEAARLERDAHERLWRCFDATREAQRLRVCERITDDRGAEFTDASAWFWAAALGRSSGPWLAVTTIGPIDDPKPAEAR